MRLRLVKEPFDHPDDLFESKHDAFRSLLYLEREECRLVSRNLKQLRFDSLEKALAELPVDKTKARPISLRSGGCGISSVTMCQRLARLRTRRRVCEAA